MTKSNQTLGSQANIQLLAQSMTPVTAINPVPQTTAQYSAFSM